MKGKHFTGRSASKRKVRVLVVEDSAVMREMLSEVLSSDPYIEVIGKVKNGLEAIEFVKKDSPDVITMDVNMPVMNGLIATRRIMETTPVPIIIVSDTVNPSDVNDTFRTLEAGAVSVIHKPSGYGSIKNYAYKSELCRKVKLMSEIKLVRRISSSYSIGAGVPQKEKPKEVINEIKREFKLVAIGASTGGPVVLEKILSSLPKGFPLPIIVVQHITEGFTLGLADWLNATSSVPVVLPSNGEKMVGGKCYIAPDKYHIKVGHCENIILSEEPPVYSSRPSVSVLFRSIAETCTPGSIGILLTGMGSDGAEELKMMRNKGALTIAQNKETSIVFGMPGEAVRLGAAKLILPPEGIISLLREIAGSNS